MNKEIITSGYNKIEKCKLNLYENPISLEDVELMTILISDKVSSGDKSYKYSIGYKLNHLV